jgi:hypothetical protein
VKTFHVQKTCSDPAGYEHLAAGYAGFEAEWFEDLQFDFSQCPFFEAHLAAGLGALFTLLISQGNRVGFRGLTPKVETILRKNRFLVAAGKAPKLDTYGTTVRYQRFNAGEARGFAMYLDKRLFSMPELPAMVPPLRKAIARSLLEVFQNAETHGRSPHGVFSCGQFYPRQDRIAFTIVDTGIGFAGSLRAEGIPIRDDLAALQGVVEQGYTSRRLTTGGLGIRLLQRYLEQTKGSLEIVSHRGYWRSAGGKNTFANLQHRFPGTLVNIEFHV